jgi:hypothetical protein
MRNSRLNGESFTGLDEPKKASAVLHGALALAVALLTSTSSRNNDDGGMVLMVLRLGLTAIQRCVLQNPIGHARCRHEGIFEVLSSILMSVAHYAPTSINHTTMMLLEEETYATVAAVCLGYDLNALKATILYRLHL